MELASSLKIKLLFFFLVFGSVEVENVAVTPATRKYCNKIYKPITIFLHILRDFYKFYYVLE